MLRIFHAAVYAQICAMVVVRGMNVVRAFMHFEAESMVFGSHVY